MAFAPPPIVAVLAVSGGADSMAMLHGWLESTKLTKSVIVAHFDHRLREESEKDADFVAASAERLGVQFEKGVWSDKPAGTVGEREARDARHRFLQTVASEHGSQAIFTAHTRDDQVETVLFRILRGTGVHGLTGIPVSRAVRQGLWIVRPLLDTPRSLLREYLEERGISWREDGSNKDASKARNRIRNELIPYLVERFNPGVVDAIGGLTDSASQIRELVGIGFDAMWAGMEWSFSKHEASILRRSTDDLDAASAPMLLRHVFMLQGWPMGRMDSNHWKAISSVARKDGPPRWQGPDGMTAERTATSFVVRRRSSSGEP